MNKLAIILILCGGIVFLGNRCAPESGHSAQEEHFIHGIKKYNEPADYDISDEMLDSSNWLLVHTGLSNVSDFFTEKRSQLITSYTCSNCHSAPLDELKNKRLSGEKAAHWNIEMSHADTHTMTCTTCHSENNMNDLISPTKLRIAMDESFKLCSGCHSTQYKDWLGGAHGKMLNGWKPPRVSKTCVSCHNPHQPSFPKRFPARFNTERINK